MVKSMMLFLDPKERKHTVRLKQIENSFLLINDRVIAKEELRDFCNDCFEPLSYHEKYDTCFCEPCNAWKEDDCNDPTCEYCKIRPDRPF